MIHQKNHGFFNINDLLLCKMSISESHTSIPTNGLFGHPGDFPVTWDAKSQNLVTWGWFIDGFTTLR